MALRVLPKLLYGQGHPYAQPLTGTGTEATLKALTRADLQAFHRTWFRPNRATLIAVGPVTVADLKPRFEKLFAGWERGEAPAKAIGMEVEGGGTWTGALSNTSEGYIDVFADDPAKATAIGSVESLVISITMSPPKSGTLHTRCTASPPGMRTRVSTTGTPARRCWRTPCSTAGVCQRSSAATNQFTIRSPASMVIAPRSFTVAAKPPPRTPR